MADLKLRTTRPNNVIWVLCDQLRVQALGYRGDPNLMTPNIDNLARQGMRFDCAVAGSPWCCPFRGALLTGLYPHQNGVTQTPRPLDPQRQTIAHSFNDAGYHTAWIGKWHLDGSNSRDHYVPPERRGGFAHWCGYENNNNQNEVFVYGTGQEQPQRLDAYETDGLTDLLIDHIDDHVGGAKDPEDQYKPFFACLSVQPPHDPYVPPTNPTYPIPQLNPRLVRFRRNVPDVGWVRERASLGLCGYYHMIANLDWNIGRLRDALKNLGIDQETYIVFFSDHGDMLGSHAQFGKSSPWEESIRIPFVVAKLGGGQNTRIGKTDAVLNHVDIAPTTLGLCGVPVPEAMVGHDYADHCLLPEDPAYRNRAPDTGAEPDSAFLQQIPAKQHAHSVNTPWRGVAMRDGWKYVVTPQGDWLLHDTSSDSYEQANLVYDKVYAEQRQRCRNRLKQWIADTGDDFPMPERG